MKSLILAGAAALAGTTLASVAGSGAAAPNPTKLLVLLSFSSFFFGFAGMSGAQSYAGAGNDKQGRRSPPLSRDSLLTLFGPLAAAQPQATV